MNTYMYIHVHVHVQRVVTNPLDDSDEVFENGLPPLVSDDCSSDIMEDVWAAAEEREGGKIREWKESYYCTSTF